MLARELTKAHEELVRGPISTILTGLVGPRGEYTGVVELGLSTETIAAPSISDADLVCEFASLMEKDRISRRQAITRLARKYGLPSREVYERIERSKKLVE